jgi:hypothetical protein
MDMNLDSAPDLAAAIQTLLDPATSQLDPDRHASVFAADAEVRRLDGEATSLSLGSPGAGRMAAGAVAAGMRAIAAAQAATSSALAGLEADGDLSPAGKAKRSAEIREAASKAVEALAEEHLGRAAEALCRRESTLLEKLTPSATPAAPSQLDRLEDGLSRMTLLLAAPSDAKDFERIVGELLAAGDRRGDELLEAGALGRLPPQTVKTLRIQQAAARSTRARADAERHIFGDPARLKAATELRWLAKLKNEVRFLRDGLRARPGEPLRVPQGFELTSNT